MTIQINTDKTINGSEKHNDGIIETLSANLKRFERYITRLEVHLSDENGKKEGLKDINCIIEARLEGKQPIAVTNKDNTEEQAIAGATEKLKAALDTVIGRLHDHQTNRL